MEEMLHEYRIFVGKPEGKRPHEDIGVTIDLTGIEWEGVDLFHLSQGRDQWLAPVNTNESSGSIEGGEFLD
jgi:hypothetical protein